MIVVLVVDDVDDVLIRLLCVVMRRVTDTATSSTHCTILSIPCATRSLLYTLSLSSSHPNVARKRQKKVPREVSWSETTTISCRGAQGEGATHRVATQTPDSPVQRQIQHTTNAIQYTTIQYNHQPAPSHEQRPARASAPIAQPRACFMSRLSETS